MSRKLSKDALAYNACLAALDEAEDALEEAAVLRGRARAAADALYPGIGHGSRQSKPEVRAKADGTVVW